MLDRTLAPDYQVIKKVDIVEAVSHKLANGINVHKVNVPGQPIIRMEFIYKAGTAFEEPGTRFVSYFTLKMLNEGTKNRSVSQINSFFDGYGAFLEFSHGVEHIIITVYALSKYVDKILPVIKEILTESVFPQKELDNLKNISAQTLKVNLEKTNYVAANLFKESLFGADHPYGKTLSDDDIFSVKQESLQSFYHKNIFGRPFEIVLSGDVNEEVLGLISKSFETFSVNNDTILPNYIPSVTIANKEFVKEKEGSLQSSIRVGKIMFDRKNPEYHTFLVLNEVLGGYFGSRLVKNIREDKGYTYGIHSSIYSLKNEGYFVIGTDVKREFTQQTIDEIYKEIKILQTELIGDDELETVKNYMLGSFAGDLNTPFSLADHFKMIYFDGLDYSYYKNYVQNILNATPKDLMRLANEYLQPESMLEIIVGGK